MNDVTCDVLVIGAGPGGYVCAIRAGQLGLDTVIADKGALGGTCLNVGCIPSKALIHAAEEFHRIVEASHGATPFGVACASPAIDFNATIAWKDGIVGRLNGGVAGLLKKAGVRRVEGAARFHDGRTVVVGSAEGETRIKASRIVIATGSVPSELPNLPFGGDILSSTEALSLAQVPESLAVVGGGYIGLELGTAFAKLGAKVTIVEADDQIFSQYDAALVKPVADRLKTLGVDVLTGHVARSFEGGALSAEGKNGELASITATKVLVAIGRKPVTEGIGLDRLALAMDGPFIKIDETCQTAMRGVYAIGDVTGDPMLAHRAMAQGEIVAERLAGRPDIWDKVAMPAVCFTDPEIVTVGMSPVEAKQTYGEVEIGMFPFQANGRAMSASDEAGFTRIVATADTHQVVGAQVVGAHVSELSAGLATAIEMNARLEDIADTVHAHPTRSEGLMEASMAALGKMLHM